MTSPILVTGATPSDACGTPALTCGYSVGTATSPGTASTT